MLDSFFHFEIGWLSSVCGNNPFMKKEAGGYWCNPITKKKGSQSHAFDYRVRTCSVCCPSNPPFRGENLKGNSMATRNEWAGCKDP